MSEGEWVAFGPGSDLVTMLRAFHAHVGAPVLNTPVNWVAPELEKLRRDLLTEEVCELHDAVASRDMVAIADALADIVYVVVGTAVTYGVPLDDVLQEVHRSNMTKDPGPTGKAVKGPDYSPPDVFGVLSRYAWNTR